MEAHSQKLFKGLERRRYIQFWRRLPSNQKPHGPQQVAFI
jgi:hypothetical protein